MNTFPAQVPSYTTEAKFEDKARIARFGDGYEQRSPDGLNHARLMLNVVFQSRRSAVVLAVLNFLRTQGTATAFLWTPPVPYNTERQWVLRNGYSHAWEAYDKETLSFVVEEDFNPPSA